MYWEEGWVRVAFREAFTPGWKLKLRFVELMSGLKSS